MPESFYTTITNFTAGNKAMYSTKLLLKEMSHIHSMAACFYLVPEVQQVITHDDFLPKLQAQEDVQCTLHNTNRN